MLSRSTANTLIRSSSSLTQRRLLSKRAANILAAVDIEQSEWPLPGVYDGRWGGSGEVYESVCPATGEILARVQSVSECEVATLISRGNCVTAALASLHSTPKSIDVARNSLASFAV